MTDGLLCPRTSRLEHQAGWFANPPGIALPEVGLPPLLVGKGGHAAVAAYRAAGFIASTSASSFLKSSRSRTGSRSGSFRRWATSR